MKSVLVLFILFSLQGLAQEAAPPAKALANETELAATIVAGSTSSETYTLKQTTSYTMGSSKLVAAGRYLKTQTIGIDTARNWDASLRYEFAFSERSSGFVQHGAESDPFAGTTQRDNTDLGYKYFLAKSEPTVWFLEAGYRYSWLTPVTNAPVERAVSRLRIYTEFVQKIGEKASGKLWLEYLPSIKEYALDYQVNVEPSIAAPLSEMFSLKAGYLFKYKSVLTSPTAKYLDSFFTTALIAKF